MGKLVFDELLAKGLINRDAIGKSDPFVKVEINGVVQKTEVIDDDLNPVWREQRSKWKGWEIDAWSGGEVVFEVWDDDTAGSDFLGRASVELRKTVPPKPATNDGTIEITSEPWCLREGLKLQPRLGNTSDASRMQKNNNSLGTIFFSFTYTDQAATTHHVSTTSRSSILRKSPSASIRATSRSGPLTMYVSSLRCEDLIPQDVTSTSDPYVIVKVNGVEYRTEKIPSTLNPVFKECADWAIPIQNETFPEIEFFVWDYDSVGGDDFLGYAAKQLIPSDISLEGSTALELMLRVRPGNQKDAKLLAKQKNVQRKSEQSLGILYATLSFDGDPRLFGRLSMPAGMERLAEPALFDRFHSSLRVTLLKGVGLLDDGTNPYVEINCENEKGINIMQKIVTAKVDSSTKNTQNPVWKHEYIRREDANDVSKVTFQVKDSKVFGDAYIGYGELVIPRGRPMSDSNLVIPLNCRPGREEAEDKKTLSKHQRNHFGELVVAVLYEVVDANGGALTGLVRETSGAGGLRERSRLQIYVDHVERSLWKDENIQTTLQIGKRVMQAPQSHKQNGNYVDIRHTFEADVDKDFIHSTLSFYATGLTGKECIGVAPLDIDLRHHPTTPTPVSIELLPGDVTSCLNRLNKVESEDPTHPASLGLVTLSFVLSDVGSQPDTINLVGSTRGHQPPQQPNQLDTTRSLSRSNSPRYRTSEQPMYEPSHNYRGGGGGGGGPGGGYVVNGDDLRFEVERAEGLPMRSVYEQPDAYVIVKREGTGEEYKTCVVGGSADPRWQFGCDFSNINSEEAIVITVFDSDGTGYDTFLGEARVRISELLDTNDGGTQQHRRSSRTLNPRTSADGSASGEPRPWTSNYNQQQQPSLPKIFFKWRLKRQQDKARMQSKIHKPSVLDVVIHKASNLSTVNHVPKYAKITLNDADERRTSKTDDARWDQEFQYPVTREINVARISVWEDAQFSRFLGEAILELTATGYDEGKQTLELQPRNDSHFYSDDVKLLNSRSSGLGTLDVSWNFRTQHSRRQFPTDPYTVILNLLEAAELPSHIPHFVRVFIKGDPAHTKCSHLERGPNPKFRTQFEFTLSHDYEELVIHLYQRGDGRSDDHLVAEVSFPVGPTQSEASATEKTWCDMVPTGGSHAPSPRLLFMWKAIVDPAARQKMLRQQHQLNRNDHYVDQAFTNSHYDGSMYQNNYPVTPTPTPPLGPASWRDDPPRVHDQERLSDRSHVIDPREYHALVQQVERLTAQNRSLMAEVQQLQRSSGVVGQPRVYNDHDRMLGITVEHAETRRRVYITIQTPTDAGKIIETSRRELDLPVGDYVLRWRGAEVRNDDMMMGLTDGDVVQLCRGERFLSRRSPKYGRWTNTTASAAGGSPTRSPRRPHTSPPRRNLLNPLNNLVLNRLQRAARNKQEHLTVAIWATCDEDRIALNACCDSGFPGFSRPHPVKPGHTEIVTQGPAADLVPLILNIADRYGQVGSELEIVEVKGYIPLLTTTFRSTNDYDEGARMWEACCRPANIPGAGMKAWFYRSTEGISEGMQGIIVIDERA